MHDRPSLLSKWLGQKEPFQYHPPHFNLTPPNFSPSNRSTFSPPVEQLGVYGKIRDSMKNIKDSMKKVLSFEVQINEGDIS